MTDVQVVQILRESLMTTLIVSAPFLAVGMIVGLVVAIFQTTTSIQEQTLTFVPKIIAIFISIIVSASWMISMLVAFAKNMIMNISQVGLG
jgi:flagellar biosynthesis protein FliQ